MSAVLFKLVRFDIPRQLSQALVIMSANLSSFGGSFFFQNTNFILIYFNDLVARTETIYLIFNEERKIPLFILLRMVYTFFTSVFFFLLSGV